MKGWKLFASALIGATLLGIYSCQTLRAQDTQMPHVPKSIILKMTVTGKIVKVSDGYFIQGQNPPEVFTILNPIPVKLDNIVNSGEAVKIDVRIILGDNVEIEKISGRSYFQNQGK